MHEATSKAGNELLTNTAPYFTRLRFLFAGYSSVYHALCTKERKYKAATSVCFTTE